MYSHRQHVLHLGVLILYFVLEEVKYYIHVSQPPREIAEI